MNPGYFEFSCPVKILSGLRALEHMPFELGLLGARRPLIVTDAGVRSAGLLVHVELALSGGGMPVGAVFDEVPPDSSLQTVRRAAQAWREAHCDAIVAVGGGSVIDTAKASNILVSEGGDELLQYSGAHNLKRPLRPLLVVPTTAGTGSEVTMVAVVSDPDAGIKLPFTSAFLMPNAAVVDPRMTLTLPPRITAMTAMDAMTHAVEASTSLAANPLSDAYASVAIQKIAAHLLPVMDRPSDASARLELALASTMAGIAFSNAMVGMVHALGHSVGALCHLPHGLCMSVLLPAVLDYNLATRSERIGALLLPLRGVEVYAATPAASRPRSTIDSICALRDALHRRCGMPRTLQETGKVARGQLAAIADLAIDDGAIVFNPVEADRADLLGVLERAWA